MPLKIRESIWMYLGIGSLLAAILISASVAFSHSGKHDPGEFTYLEALKKAIGLYDQLIGNGKLEQSWENKLATVQVSNRQINDKTETRVAFHRSEGDPKTVFIFFNEKGEYAGSNFTGE